MTGEGPPGLRDQSVFLHAGNAASFAGQSTVIIFGIISPTPTASSSVVITTTGPSGAVDIGTAAVSTSTGAYTYSLVAGGNANWVSGVYTVSGKWGANGQSASATTSFAYSSAASTTSGVTVTTTVTSATTSSVTATVTSTTTVFSTPEFPYILVVPVFLGTLIITVLVNRIRKPKAR